MTKKPVKRYISRRGDDPPTDLFRSGEGRSMTTPLKDALIALADAWLSARRRKSCCNGFARDG
jgi:hypothetical protein